MKLLKLLVIFVTVGVLEANVIPGKCPAVSTKLDFDATPVIIVNSKQNIKLI